VSFLGAVELALVDALATPIGAQRGGEPLFDKAPAHALNCRDPSLEGLGNALIWPSGSAVGLIGFEEDVSVLEPANVRLAAGQQPLQFVALRRGECHPVSLGHARPPRHQPLWLTTRTPNSPLQT